MLRVSLRCLEVFVTAVEAGSFSAASERLEISQPSVSAHILALERDVGGRLFTRRRGARPVLTELGQSVFEHARDLLAEARDLRADVVTLQSAAGQRVVLSCQRSLANFALHRPLTAFAFDHQSVQLVVCIGKQEEVLGDMREGRSDIGCLLTNDEPRGLTSEVIGRQRLTFIAAPDHPLAGRRRLAPEAIAAASFVGPPPESMYGRSIERLLAGFGIAHVRTVAQATEYQFLRELVAGRVGIAVAAASSIQDDVRLGRLAELDVAAEPIWLDIRLIFSPTRPITPAMGLLRTALHAVA